MRGNLFGFPRRCQVLLLADDFESALIGGFRLSFRLGRKLQYCSELPLGKIMEHDCFAVRELQGIMVSKPVVAMQLAETGNAMLKSFAEITVDRTFASRHVFVKRQLSPWKHANRHVRLADAGKTVAERAGE